MTKDTDALREALGQAYEKVKEWPERNGDPMEVGGQGFMDLLALRNLIPDAIAALATPASDVGPVGERPVLIEWITELARRDILRTQTDFIGRMHQTICEFESICDDNPDGELDEAARDDAGEALAGLAGLALAQLAMVSDPADPIKQLAHPPLAQSVDQALLARAETAWQRFFYPANDCFDKSPAGNKLPFVDLEVADCLRLLLSAVGHEVRPPAGGEVSIIAPADPTVACLKLDVAAQECLQDSAYKAGLAAGWNFAHSDDEAGFQRARSSTEHVAELRRIRAERTAIRNLKGQTS